MIMNIIIMINDTVRTGRPAVYPEPGSGQGGLPPYGGSRPQTCAKEAYWTGVHLRASMKKCVYIYTYIYI